MKFSSFCTCITGLVIGICALGIIPSSVRAQSGTVNGVDIYTEVLDANDYTDVRQSGTAYANSVPSLVLDSSGYSLRLYAKATGNTGSGGEFLGHAYRKVRRTLTYPSGNPTTLSAVTATRSRLWSTNVVINSWIGQGGANVSFDGASAVGSGGSDTGTTTFYPSGRTYSITSEIGAESSGDPEYVSAFAEGTFDWTLSAFPLF